MVLLVIPHDNLNKRAGNAGVFSLATVDKDITQIIAMLRQYNLLNEVQQGLLHLQN